MRTRTLLTTAAVALVFGSGAIAQSQRTDQRPGQIERLQDVNRHTSGDAQTQGNTAGGGRDLNGRNESAGAQNQPPQNQSAQQPAQKQPANARRPAQNAQQPAAPGTARSSSGNAAQNQQQPSTASQPAQQNAQPSATAQQPRQSAQPSTTAQQPSQAGQPAQAGQPTARSTQGNTSGAQQNAQSNASGVVALNAQQQTRISQTISRHNVKPLTNVNFSISIGTKVPRSVQLRALPADIVTFVPQYRGYSYVLVEEQIVIVEPATYEIVAIVPYGGGTKAATRSRTMTSKSVSLDTGQREAIRKHVTRERKPGSSATVRTRERYSVGERVPRTVTVEEFSEPVYREVPTVRRYRYFRDDDDVVLVDPDEDRIVDIIR